MASRKDSRALLRKDLKRTDAELDRLEREIPENVRDLETLEAFLRGDLDDNGRPPCRVRSELRVIMGQFVDSYPKLRAYGALLRFKWNIEALLEADVTSHVRFPTVEESAVYH